MPRRLAAIAGAEVAWLLELRFGGRDYRWSTRHLALINGSGDSLDFGGSLELDSYSESLDRFTHTADAQSIALEVVFPDIDLSDQVAKGYPLGAVEGEISLVQVLDGSPQQTYEERSIVMRGSVSDPQYGQPDRPTGYMAFSLEAALAEDSGSFLEPGQILEEESLGSLGTWPDDNSHIGKPYPIVFGRPGMWRKPGSTGALTSAAATPAYIRTQVGSSSAGSVTSLLIAGHHVLASDVRVKSTKSGEDQKVFQGFDDLGQPVSWVDFRDIDGAGTITGFSATEVKDSEWWIGWTRSGGYGLENPWAKGQGLGQAGDLIRWALTYSTLPVDWGAWQAVADVLNGYEFSGYISDSEISPWDWLQGLWALLPITVRRGVNGIYPVLHDTGITSDQAIKITSSPDFSRAGPVQLEGSLADISNRIELAHAFNARDNSARTYSALGQFESQASEPEAGSSSIVKRSEERHGSRLLQESSAYIYQRSTADRICHDLARRHAPFARTVQYRAAQSFVWLELGDSIALTDTDLGYADRLSQVIARAWEGDAWLITLVLDSDPDRDNPAT
tara:strand:- start:7676 stop:9361 length:1686 start_codon:yes stop_codon:yes gene_type:complete